VIKQRDVAIRAEAPIATEEGAVSAVERWKEWRRFLAETLCGTALILAAVVERLRPDAADLVPHGYCYQAMGIGLALLTGLGEDVIGRLISAGTRR